jgi:hypothetical protein
MLVPNQVIFCKSDKFFGLTSSEEQKFCTEYASILYTGVGEIVDLGCFLGSLTKAILVGLQEKNQRFIFAYDLWKVEEWFLQFREWMNQNNVGMDREYNLGDSYLDIFIHELGLYAKNVITRGDILTEKPFESPIEFLVVDAMKSWEIANAIIEKFYNKLIPSVSYVFHQDFKYHLCPWIPMIQWHLREYFEIYKSIEDAPEGTSHTVVFRYVKEIPKDVLSIKYHANYFTQEQIAEACVYWNKYVPHPLLKMAFESIIKVC